MAALTTSDLVRQGTILWLPPLSIVQKTYAERNGERGHSIHPRENAAPEFFNHPVLIIDHPASDSYKAYFFPLTSFNGVTNINKRFDRNTPNGSYLINSYVPIGSANKADSIVKIPHKDELYRMLTIKSGRMNRKGYVNIRTVYEVDWRDLQNYRIRSPTVKRLELDRVSMNRLLLLIDRLHWHVPGVQYEEPPVDASEKKKSSICTNNTPWDSVEYCQSDQPQILPVQAGKSSAFVETSKKTEAASKICRSPASIGESSRSHSGDTSVPFADEPRETVQKQCNEIDSPKEEGRSGDQSDYDGVKQNTAVTDCLPEDSTSSTTKPKWGDVVGGGILRTISQALLRKAARPSTTTEPEVEDASQTSMAETRWCTLFWCWDWRRWMRNKHNED